MRKKENRMDTRVLGFKRMLETVMVRYCVVSQDCDSLNVRRNA